MTDLTKRLGVTRTAISEPLRELRASGLIVQSIQRLGNRGRPFHVYEATAEAMETLAPKLQCAAAAASWEAIEQVGGADLLEAIQEKTGEILARRYHDMLPNEDPKDRVARFISILREEGFVMDCFLENGKAVLSKRNCPFVGIQTCGGDFCKMHRRIIALALRLPVVSVESRRNGEACCRFEIQLEP